MIEKWGFARAYSRKTVILTEALLFKFGVRLLLFFLPVRSVLQIAATPKQKTVSPDLCFLRTLRWALHKGGRVSKENNRCLVKSVAGRWMLHRRGISSQLFFGVRLDNEDKIVAHAWLSSCGFELVSAGEGYTFLAGF